MLFLWIESSNYYIKYEQFEKNKESVAITKTTLILIASDKCTVWLVLYRNRLKEVSVFVGSMNEYFYLFIYLCFVLCFV